MLGIGDLLNTVLAKLEQRYWSNFGAFSSVQGSGIFWT